MFAQRPGWWTRAVPNSLVQHQTPTRFLLTFDDGPHPVHTPAVLTRLAEYRLQAVFFLVGQRVERAPHVVSQIRDAGHVIGNHTHRHKRWPFIANRSVHSDVMQCQQIIANAGGGVPTLFRPPFGRLTPGVLNATWRMRLSVMKWSLDSQDWMCRSAADAELCAQGVVKSLQEQDIVLFHDDHEYIVPILDRVLPQIAQPQAMLAAGTR